MRAMGVDPGLANMGVAVIDHTPGAAPVLTECYVVATAKNAKNGRRVTDDDLDRMNVLWLNLHQTVVAFQPDIIGVESYTVFQPGQGGHGKGAGWKALYAYAMTCAVAFEHKTPVRVFRPTDMKRQIAANVSASKRDVEAAVRSRVANLDDFLRRIPAARQEHAADAVGHALCALEQHS